MLGIYCRISKLKEEGKDRSIGDQRLHGIEKAKELGMPFELFIDVGISAASDDIEDRPEFCKLLDKIESGVIKAVFAFDQSRLEREPQVRFLVSKIFKKHNVSYYTYIEGKVDINDPQTEFMGDIISIINKYQVTMTKIKVKSILKGNALEGKVHGMMQYGYEKDVNGKIAISEAESETVKLIFKLSLNGMGTNSIADYMNKTGIPTRYNIIGRGTLKTKNKYTNNLTVKNKTDIKWAGNTIRGIIKNPIYFGKRKFGGIVYDVPAIMEEYDWKKVNENLKNNANTRGKKITYHYLLKGLVRCACCGRNMYGKTRASKKDHYYMCSSKRIKGENCLNRSINIDKLDNFIWAVLFEKRGFIERLEAISKSDDGTQKILIQEIAFDSKTIEALKKDKSSLITMKMRGFISDEEFLDSKKDLDNKLKLMEQNLRNKEDSVITYKNELEKVNEIKDKFIHYTKNLPFEDKIKAIHEFLKNITVKFVDGKFYEISLEFNFGLATEKWKTANVNSSWFIRNFLGKDGKPSLSIIIPTSLNSNETEFEFNKFKNSLNLIREIFECKNEEFLPNRVVPIKEKSV